MARKPTAPQLGRSLAIGKKIWAIGLNWHLFADKQNMTRKAARQAAKKQGADLVLARPGKQYATAKKGSGYVHGIPSLAAAIAEDGDASFLGAFRVPQGIYSVVIREGVVLSNADRLYTDENEAFNDYGTFLNESEWESKVAPQEWNVPGASPIALNEMVLAPASRVKLVEVSYQRVFLGVGAVAMVCALGYGAELYYEHLQEEDRLEALQAQQRLEMAEKRKALLARQIHVPDVPWVKQPHGSAMLEKCVGNIIAKPKAIAGWSIDSVVCTTNSTVMNLTSAGGTVNWIRPFVDEADISIVTQDKAVVTWKNNVDDLAKWAVADKGQSPAEWKRYLISQFSEQFEKPTISPPTRPQITAYRGGDKDTAPVEVQVPAPWQVTNLQLQTDKSLVGYKDILDKLQVFTLSSVTFKLLSTPQWQLEGNIYHYDPPPEAVAAR